MKTRVDLFAAVPGDSNGCVICHALWLVNQSTAAKSRIAASLRVMDGGSRRFNLGTPRRLRDGSGRSSNFDGSLPALTRP